MLSIQYGHILVALMDKLVEVYKANAKGVSSKRLKMIRTSALITELVLKIGIALYSLTGVFYLTNPLYAYYTRHERVHIILLFIPFIDETTNSGFGILSAIHLICMILGVIAIAGSDFLFVMIILNVPLLSSIFSENIDELNGILRAEMLHVRSMRANLRNILLMHRENQE